MPRIVMGVLCGLVLAATAQWEAQAQVRILYLNKSAGFEHGAVKRNNGQASLSEQVLTKLAQENGAEITCTKDASLINADNLKKYDVVIFYTTGVLTESKEGEPGMGPNGLAEFIQWIENGGGFIGIHAATDTFGTPEGAEPTPYSKLIGGTFAEHGQQFEGTVKVVDPGHPTMASIPQDWTFLEEWYKCRFYDTENMHVLALLDPGAERGKQQMYNIPSYPIIWCKSVGKGRVYYNALGHNDSVWNDATFQKSIVDAAKWAKGDGPANTEPNFDKVVPKDIPAEAPKP